MDYSIKRNLPLFVQICDSIRKDILGGVLPPESQIPSVRQLALAMSANPNTVQKALTKLEEEGLLYTKGTVGRFVTSDKAVIEGARRKVKREALEMIMSEAYSLGITKEDIIEFLNKEDDV